jgi:hypothetical protein
VAAAEEEARNGVVLRIADEADDGMGISITARHFTEVGLPFSLLLLLLLLLWTLSWQ